MCGTRIHGSTRWQNSNTMMPPEIIDPDALPITAEADRVQHKLDHRVGDREPDEPAQDAAGEHVAPVTPVDEDHAGRDAHEGHEGGDPLAVVQDESVEADGDREAQQRRVQDPRPQPGARRDGKAAPSRACLIEPVGQERAPHERNAAEHARVELRLVGVGDEPKQPVPGLVAGAVEQRRERQDGTRGPAHRRQERIQAPAHGDDRSELWQQADAARAPDRGITRDNHQRATVSAAVSPSRAPTASSAASLPGRAATWTGPSSVGTASAAQPNSLYWGVCRKRRSPTRNSSRS